MTSDTRLAPSLGCCLLVWRLLPQRYICIVCLYDIQRMYERSTIVNERDSYHATKAIEQIANNAVSNTIDMIDRGNVLAPLL